MKTTVLKLIVPVLAGAATSAFAAGPADPSGNSLLLWFFIGFGAMVVLFQAAPAVLMFVAMLRGLLSSDPAKTAFSPFKGNQPK